MEKLVRDLIPEIIKQEGQHSFPCRSCQKGEYLPLLKKKLVEEVAEYLESGDPLELADILEVVYSLGAQAHKSPEDLEDLRSSKALQRGAFKQGLVMDFPDQG